MTRNLLLALVLLTATESLIAETIISPGDVSGNWNAGGSPYLIDGNIRVPASDGLQIGAGVQVIFRGYYLFTVNGRLECTGTATDTVRLTFDLGEDETGWQGMRISSDDTLSLSYTIIENVRRYENANCGLDISSSAVRLDHCLIRNVTGNGIHAQNGSMLVATDCVFRDNGFTMSSGLGSACLIRQQSTMIGSRCLFADNFSQIDGGAIHAGIGCLLALDSCRFEHNVCNLWGGAIDVNSANLRISRCEFVNNQGAKGGVAYLQTPDTTLFDHCTFNGNIAAEGAAIYVYSGTTHPVTALHCDFIRNQSTIGGVIRAEFQTTVKHSIFFENTGASIHFSVHDSRAEYNSFFPDIVDLFSGEVPTGLGERDHLNHNGDSVDTFQNLFADPVFINELEDDFHLQEDSPCIDAGDPAFPFDQDSTVADLGRYSFTQTTSFSTHTLLPTKFGITVFPNPFNSALSISLDVPINQEASVSLYDLLGREVDVIYRGRMGTNTISYAVPAGMGSGAYFIRAATGENSVIQKVVLLK